jgi:hypothetical protein
MEITAHYLVAEISTPPDSQVLRSAQQVANVASSTSWITCHPPQPATSSGEEVHGHNRIADVYLLHICVS